MKDLIKKILKEHTISERVFWDLEKVKEVSRKYNRLQDFRVSDYNAFQWAKKNGFLDDVTSHMQRDRIFKSREEIQNLVKDFENLKDFIKEYPNEYRNARNRGWLDIFANLKPSKENWTLEKVLDKAKQTKTMEEFRNTFPRAYDAARNHQGWKEEVWKLFKPQHVDWTYDFAKSIADKYDDLTDFTSKESKAIAAIRRLGWLDLLSHMKKDKRSWTDNEIKQEALKYDNVKDFREKSSDAYYAAFSHKIYDEVTAHMKRAYIDWTKDMVWKEALNYRTRSDFMKGNYAAYQAAHNKGWYDDVTSHMVRVGNLYKRLVYAYEFPDNSVYVGLTFDKDDRDYRHKTKEKSAVYQQIKKTGNQPIIKFISDDYIDAQDAINLEHCTIEKYRQEGWTILNKAKAGGLGGCSKRWTKDEVKSIALNYNNPTEFRAKHSSAFNAAKRNNWLDEILSHMTNRKNRYTSEDIKNQMTQYKSGTELRKQNEKLWSVAYRRLGSKFITDFYKK
jgi:hypothetical protein